MTRWPLRPGTLSVLLAAVLWGTTGTAQALAPAAAEPTAVGALRLAIAGVALLLWAAGRRQLMSLRGWPLRATLLAAVCMAAYQPLFFSAVKRAGVAPGTVVAIGSAPLLAGLLAWLVQRERPDRRWAVATPLAILGVALLLGGAELRPEAGGIGLALVAGAAYALYAVVSKSLIAGYPHSAVLAVVFGLAALLLVPVLLGSDLSWALTRRGALAVLHLGLLATAVAYLLFVRGLAALPVSRAVTLSLAEPMTAVLLGLVVLRERLAATAALGLVLILAALVLVSLRPSE